MAPTRVSYRERQILRWGDLATDQAYHTTSRWRHNRMHHGWGIVAGLNLDDTDQVLTISPGMAVDGYGRELILPAACTPEWPTGALLVDVWLHYATEPVTTLRRGRHEHAAHCDRWRETALVQLTPAVAESTIDPYRPPGVSSAELNAAPHADAPVGSSQHWPVYLGRVSRAKGSYRICDVPRPYVTLVGEVIETPPARPPQSAQLDDADPEATPIDERVRVQIGAELPADRRRFSIATAGDDGKLHERLSISRDWQTTIAGPLRISGDLLLGEPAPEVGQVDSDCPPQERRRASHSIELRRLPELPSTALHRSLYRVAVPADESTHDELRIEIENPGNNGDPANHTLVIGAWSDTAGEFTPCLRIAADFSVVLYGDLIVESGQVIEAPITPDLADERFVANQTGLQLATRIDTQSLGVEIKDLSVQSSDSSDPLTYTLTLINNSPARITDLAVYETLIERGVTTRLAGQVTLPRTYLDGNPGTVATSPSDGTTPAHQLIINRALPLSGNQDARSFLVITVMGVGPALNMVYATASKPLVSDGLI